MRVANIAVARPLTGNKPVQQDAPADAQAFTQLLDEKTAASAVKSPLPARGAAKADCPEERESAPADATDSAAADDTVSGSLLILLNQFRDVLPSGAATKKEALPPEEDALPGSGLLFGAVQPLARLTHADLNPQNLDTTASDEHHAGVAEASLLPGAADASAAHPEEGGVCDSTRHSAPAAVLKPAASEQNGQNDAAAIPPFSMISATVGQAHDAPQPAMSAVLVKGAGHSHSAEPVIPSPDLALPAAAGNPSRNAVVNEPAAASGLLSQQMGTPAWQQSLGQQIACFTRDGIQHAELRLHPEELGSIQITLQLKNEQAQMHFVSASHQVRAAIEAAVPHLRTSLAESGIELGQSSVGADSTSGWKDSGQPDQSGRQNFAQARHDENNAGREERIEKSGRTGRYRAGINTFA